MVTKVTPESAGSIDLPHDIETDVFAALNYCKPASIRSRLASKGSFWGIRPTKLPGGKLLWPAVQVVVEVA